MNHKVTVHKDREARRLQIQKTTHDKLAPITVGVQEAPRKGRIMKRFLVPLSLLLLAACTQVTPTPTPQAELSAMSFGSSRFDIALGLAKHSSGVYAVGQTEGNLHATHQGNGDAFLRKYDTSGTVIWGRQFGTSQYETAKGVASDAGNNAYVVGKTSGILTGSPGGSGDIFLRKYRTSGGVAWTRQFGDEINDFGEDVAVVGSNVYVVGAVTDVTLDLNAYLAKYNTSGGLLWTKTFGTSVDDYAYDVAVDGSGNAYVVGYTYGTLPGSRTANGGGADMFIRKYNANGTIAWTEQYHESDAETARAVTVSGSNVYLVGDYAFQNDTNDTDIRIIKLTTSGGLIWETRWNPTTDQTSTDISFNGGLYVSSYESTNNFFDGVVRKYSGAGGLLWTKTQASNEDDFSFAVLARTSSEVYVGGATTGVLGGGNSGVADAFLRRLNGSNGTTVWTDQ